MVNSVSITGPLKYWKYRVGVLPFTGDYNPDIETVTTVRSLPAREFV